MPHQCLKCGTLFPDGTTTILRGCPDCHGTRFFFTHEPLPSTAREKLLEKTERDLPALLQEILAQPPEPGERIRTVPAPDQPTPAPARPRPSEPSVPKPKGVLLPGNKLLIKLPKQVRGRVRRALVQWDYEVSPSRNPITEPPRLRLAPDSSPLAQPTGSTPTVAPEGPLPVSVSEIDRRLQRDSRPETVRIDQPGEYEIDVKRLLESSPIVIQRDGTYLLHLPSIFDSARRPENRPE